MACVWLLKLTVPLDAELDRLSWHAVIELHLAGAMRAERGRRLFYVDDHTQPVQDEVWTLLDGECTAETRDKLAHHLEECPGCLRYYGVEERIKTLIARKCGGEKAPEGLRARLMMEISRTTIIKY